MAVSFDDYILSCYRRRGYDNSLPQRLDNIHSIETGINSLSIQCDMRGDTFEVPCIMLSSWITAMRSVHLGRNKLIYPLMQNNHESFPEVKSANPLLKTFFYDSREDRMLYKRGSAGEMYLGGKGLVLYSDYTPMVMLTVTIQKAGRDENGNQLYTPICQTCRINSIIYQKEDLLAKNLRSKFIQNLLLVKNNFMFSYSRYCMTDWGCMTNSNLNFEFKVIIDDMQDFFISPTVPTVNVNNETINQFLVDNFDRVIDTIMT